MTASLLVVLLAATPHVRTPEARPPPSPPLVSRSVPVVASAGNAEWGRDAVFPAFAPDHLWSCTGDCWLAFDLSGLTPAARRRLLAVLTFGGNVQQQLEVGILGGNDLTGFPSEGYALEAAPELGGPWVPLVHVSPLLQASRLHRLDLGARTWLRLRAHGSVRAKVALWDVSRGAGEVFAIFGDSITSNSMVGPPEAWFSTEVESRRPGIFPPLVGGGIAFTTAQDGRDVLVHGRGNFARGLTAPLVDAYAGVTRVGLAFGTNDSAAGPTTDELGYLRATEETVRAFLSRGARVAVAMPPWAPDARRQDGLRRLAGRLGLHASLVPDWSPRTYAALDHVWSAGAVWRCVRGGVSSAAPERGASGPGEPRWERIESLRERLAADVRAGRLEAGPDFWTLFEGRPEWLADGLHPNATGTRLWRSTWVSWAVGVLDR